MVAEESPNCVGVSFWRGESLFAIRIAVHPTNHFPNISRKCKYMPSLVLPSGNYCPEKVLNQHRKHGVGVAKDKRNTGKTRRSSIGLQIRCLGREEGLVLLLWKLGRLVGRAGLSLGASLREA